MNRVKGVSHIMLSLAREAVDIGSAAQQFPSPKRPELNRVTMEIPAIGKTQVVYLEPEPRIGRFSKAFFLPLLREFIARRKSFSEVIRCRQRHIDRDYLHRFRPAFHVSRGQPSFCSRGRFCRCQALRVYILLPAFGEGG